MDADNDTPPAVEPLDEQTQACLTGLLQGRRTINLFDTRPAPEAELMAAIDVARWAPNHRLTQPWRFRLLGPQAREAVIGVDVALAVARNGPEVAERRRARLDAVPGWFVVTSARAEDALVETENYAATACAVQNLALYLWGRGIGLKWTTGPVTRDTRFFDALGIDATAERVVGLFWYGYPAMVPAQKRLPCEEIVERLP